MDAANLSVVLCSDPAQIKHCLDIRMEVFVHEQGFTLAEELDKKDARSDQLLLLLRGSDPVGTIRCWTPATFGDGETWCKLGRLAVRKEFRGIGAGRVLVNAFEEHLKERRGFTGMELQRETKCVVEVHSQVHAEGFYAKLGYVREGEEFLEDGDPHVRMIKTLPLSETTKPPLDTVYILTPLRVVN